jgi:hypothetical protein
MFTVKITGAKEMVADLKKMREKAVPYALKNALNTAAFETRNIWQREIKSAFTNRSTYTANSVRVEQATTTKLEARTGSVATFMGKQETGGTVTGTGGRKPIPAPVAAGQAPGGKRTRLVRAGFRLGAIQAKHPVLKGDRKQRNAIAIAVAVRSGTKRAVLERPGGGKGLFVVGGRAKAPTTRLLWNVSRASVHVPATPTLERALAAVRPKMQHILEAALLEQLRRHNIAGY